MSQSQSSTLISHAAAVQGNTSNPKVSAKQIKQVSSNAQAQGSQAAQREILKSSASVGAGGLGIAHKAILQIQAPKVVHLQSPPSRILVKASPRISPNPKIRKQAIQTCKVSIDALQKTTSTAAQQKITRAHSKEFLKTIKLMKRGSNSPSPAPFVHPKNIKSSQASPSNSVIQANQHGHQSALRGLKSS